jgi:hypothetical protein
MGLLGSVGAFILAVFSGAFNAVFDLVKSIFSGIGEFLGGVIDSILGTITGAIKAVVSKIPSFLLPDGLKEWANSADEATKEAAANMRQATSGEGAPAAADGVSPAAAAASVSNTEYVNDYGDFTFNITSTDPAAAGQEAAGQFRRVAAAANTGVKS